MVVKGNFMQTYSIKIEYPENFPDALQTTRAGFEHEARMAMVVKLFEMKRITFEMAAQLAGIDHASLLLELSRYNAPITQSLIGVLNPSDTNVGGFKEHLEDKYL
jgi:hypothetical protein